MANGSDFKASRKFRRSISYSIIDRCTSGTITAKLGSLVKLGMVKMKWIRIANILNDYFLLRSNFRYYNWRLSAEEVVGEYSVGFFQSFMFCEFHFIDLYKFKF